MVHFRHIIVNTLFKGDDDDDDDDNNIKSKSMHGQFYRDLERPPVDKEKSLTWLCSPGLRGEKESFITAVQNRALSMHYHQTNIMNQQPDGKCRMCYNEHIKHIVVGCTTLSPPEYTNRHNKVAGYSHWTICKQ